MAHCVYISVVTYDMNKTPCQHQTFGFILQRKNV